MTDNLHLVPAERKAVGREFMSSPADAPSVTDIFLVKHWSGGPTKGKAKLTKAVRAWRPVA
ncbi:MAG: hypothetical protein WCJ64_20935 [Rhodospirillaceae bacterium]